MSAIIKEERIGGQRLILGDCLEVMRELGEFDLCLTDPPYGIDAAKGKGGAMPFKGGKVVNRLFTPDKTWDTKRPDIDCFDLIRARSKLQIIWGGNYFADLLPAMGKWLWWDKCQTMPTYGDGELAWTNLSGKTPRKFTYANNKLFANRVKRYHTTQKPLPLIEWCLSLAPHSKLISDPYLGSGTTLVACQRLGRNGTGIELDPEYFEIACKRVEEASRQVDLFIAPPKKQKPEPAPNLFDGDAA